MLICFSISNEWFLSKWPIVLLSGNKAILTKRMECKGNFFSFFRENLNTKPGYTGFSGFISFRYDVVCCFFFLYLQVKQVMLYILTEVLFSFPQHLYSAMPLKRTNSSCDCLLCDMLYNLMYIYLYPSIARNDSFHQKKTRHSFSFVWDPRCIWENNLPHCFFQDWEQEI